MKRGGEDSSPRGKNPRSPEDGGWSGGGGRVDLSAIALLTSSRVDSAFLRFELLSALTKRPLSKVEALRLLGISRPYLDRILKEWTSLTMVKIRDASPQHILRPMMAISLVRRPLLSLTRLDGHVENVEEVSDLKEILLALTSQTRRAILMAVGDGKMGVKGLQEEVRIGDIHRHIRILLKTRLLAKLRIPRDAHEGRQCSVALMKNYRSLRFWFKPYGYPQ